MKISRMTSTLVAAVMGAFILAPIQPPSASQATTAKATNNTLSISSGTLVVFATATQTFTNTNSALSTSVSNGATKTFYINNSGSFTVSRFVMTITLPNNSNVSAFRRCALNISFIGNNACSSGSSVNLTHPVSGSATTYIISLPGNSYYSFQIVQNKSGTMTVNTSASTQYVTGSTSNS